MYRFFFPSVDICLHMHKQRRPNCSTCSAPVYSVMSAAVCRATKMWILSRSTIRGFHSSVQLQQSSQAVGSCLKFSPTSLSSPSPFILEEASTEESAEQSMIPDKRSCLQRVPIHPAERLTGRPSCQKNQEYYKSCSPQELAEILRVLKTNPAVRMASVRREEVPEEGRGVFDQQLL